MKTWFVIVSVVAVLLAFSTGIGFWMLNDTRAELADTKVDLADAKVDLANTEAELAEIEAELIEIKEDSVSPAPAPTYTLSVSVNPSGGGSVSPSSGNYESGLEVTLRADPVSGYTFDRWGGDISGIWSTIVVTMDSDKDITAYFEEEPPTSEPTTFTGSSDRTTPPFTVTTSEWIIDWSYVPDYEYPEYAGFGFYVYPRGETVMYVESVLSGSTSGSTYSYAGPGEYYVEVLAANLKSWTIIISPA